MPQTLARAQYLVHGLNPNLSKERAIDKGASELVIEGTDDY